MTQPAEGAPGAQPPAPAPTAPAPAPGAPAAPPVTPAPQSGLDPNAPVDVASLPPNVQQMIKNLNKEAGGHRQTATAAKQQLDAVLAALGRNPDGATATDPAAAATQLNERTAQAEDRAWGATVKLGVFQRATQLGADPQGLLDSITFVDSLDELTDADPSSALFTAALDAKIAAAMDANPNLKAKTAAAPGGRSGGEFSGGSGAGLPISEAQLAQMSNAEKVQALRDGKLQHLL